LPKIGAWLRVVESRDTTCAALPRRRFDMLKHIVMWKFKDQAEGAGKAANLLKAKALLDGCAGLVPGLLRLEVAIAQPQRWNAPTTWCCTASLPTARRSTPTRTTRSTWRSNPSSARRGWSASAWTTKPETGGPAVARTVQQLFDLKGQSALVTGGSRGLGLQMAHALGEAGARDAERAQGR
jgi:hypothetical protein